MSVTHTAALSTQRAGRPMVVLRALATRLQTTWAPRVTWAVGRTGAPGITGIALLAASAVFLFSTHLPLLNEVSDLRADLKAKQSHGPAQRAAKASTTVMTAARAPTRADMPRLLGVLLQQADAAQLSIDTAKYEASAVEAGGLVRYRISFPIDGPYSNVRQFLDSTLQALPAVSLDELDIARKSIADSAVEAQVRMTFFTRAEP